MGLMNLSIHYPVVNSIRGSSMLLFVLTLGLLSFGAASSRSHMERYAEPECRPIPPRLNINNSAMLFIDHQSGLINLIGDYTPDEFKNNLLALIDGVKLAGIPVILTTSFEEGPNGPMVPELKAAFPDAPYIARPGQINAWDNSDFRDAVRDTGKHQLIVAGVVTDVCVAFPVMDALREGYDVYVVADASGTFNQQVADAALMRMNQAGASITNWFAVVCELMRDWRNDMKGLAEVLSSHLAAYKALILSYNDVEALNPLGS